MVQVVLQKFSSINEVFEDNCLTIINHTKEGLKPKFQLPNLLIGCQTSCFKHTIFKLGNHVDFLVDFIVEPVFQPFLPKKTNLPFSNARNFNTLSEQLLRIDTRLDSVFDCITDIPNRLDAIDNYNSKHDKQIYQLFKQLPKKSTDLAEENSGFETIFSISDLANSVPLTLAASVIVGAICGTLYMQCDSYCLAGYGKSKKGVVDKFRLVASTLVKMFNPVGPLYGILFCSGYWLIRKERAPFLPPLNTISKDFVIGGISVEESPETGVKKTFLNHPVFICSNRLLIISFTVGRINFLIKALFSLKLNLQPIKILLVSHITFNIWRSMCFEGTTNSDNKQKFLPSDLDTKIRKILIDSMLSLCAVHGLAITINTLVILFNFTTDNIANLGSKVGIPTWFAFNYQKKKNDTLNEKQDSKKEKEELLAHLKKTNAENRKSK